MENILTEAERNFSYTQSLRRDFHMHPELGFQEFRTAGIVVRELNELGYEVKTGVGKTGVVALLEGAQAGPTLMLRFDMDALPISEQTNAPYASQNPGVMHACGHDGHTAVGLTVAKILKGYQNQLHGTVKIIFQPAEEGLGGAKAMLADDVLNDPRPDMALGMHVWSEKPLGWLGISAGPVMASSEIFQICLKGKGGHGGMPQLTVDPILAAAQVVSALQSIVARNIAPLQSAVVSVTMIHGGEANNIIPAQVDLQVTIRTFDPEVRQLVLERIREIVTSVSAGMGCEAEIQFETITPTLVNDEQAAQRLQRIARQVFPDHHLDTTFQAMVSEDMAYFLEEIPGCFVFVGSADHERGLDYALHHPCFDMDETVLKHGVALITAAALDFLQ